MKPLRPVNPQMNTAGWANEQRNELTNVQAHPTKTPASGGQKPFCKKVSGLLKTFGLHGCFILRYSTHLFKLNKSFVGVQGVVFQKSPLAAGGRGFVRMGVDVRLLISPSCKGSFCAYMVALILPSAY